MTDGPIYGQGFCTKCGIALALTSALENDGACSFCKAKENSLLPPLKAIDTAELSCLLRARDELVELRQAVQKFARYQVDSNDMNASITVSMPIALYRQLQMLANKKE